MRGTQLPLLTHHEGLTAAGIVGPLLTYLRGRVRSPRVGLARAAEPPYADHMAPGDAVGLPEGERLPRSACWAAGGRTIAPDCGFLRRSANDWHGARVSPLQRDRLPRSACFSAVAGTSARLRQQPGKVDREGLLPVGRLPPPAGGREGGMRGRWVGNAWEPLHNHPPRRHSNESEAGGPQVRA
jgi:hypothetical protein